MTQQCRTVGTPLGAVGRGLVAGAVGTLTMDVVLYARYRRGGGKRDFPTWEFSADNSSWDEAPAAAQVCLRRTGRYRRTARRGHRN
jgi:hypothetical protein